MNSEINNNDNYIEGASLFSVPDLGVNAMAKGTYEQLIETLNEAKTQFSHVRKSIGEASANADWHDNFAFEDARRESQLLESIISARTKQLENPFFIKPRKEIDLIGLGNACVVEFEDGEEETFTLLGPNDSILRDGCVSYSTNIAKQLLGKQAGTVVKVDVNNKTITIKIKKILPGDFD